MFPHRCVTRHAKISITAIVLYAVIILAPLPVAIGQDPSTPATPSIPRRDPSAHTQQDPDMSATLGVLELKIQMAEGSLKLNPSERNLTSLISSLEESLNTSCLKSLPVTLKYEGPPTNPNCIARMERLLEINPDNPAAICLRDGIAAPSCLAAYRDQKLVEFYDSSSLLEDLPDPSLKVGLSAVETQRLKVLSEMLENINRQFQNAESSEDKNKSMDDAVGVYDQLLSLSCRIVALRLRPLTENDTAIYEPSRIVEARKQLLQIPKNMRGDYQTQMLRKVEEELALYTGNAKGKQELLDLMAVINQPDNSKPLTAIRLERSRVVLSSCYRFIEQATKFIPLFPAPKCHAEGWYSPQCINALKQWRNAKRQRLESERPAKAPVKGIISKF